MKPHQFDGIFWSEQFKHGVKVSVSRAWSSDSLLQGRGLLMKLLSLAVLQQEDRPLHKGKALPEDRQRPVSLMQQVSILLGL